MATAEPRLPAAQDDGPPLKQRKPHNLPRLPNLPQLSQSLHLPHIPSRAHRPHRPNRFQSRPSSTVLTSILYHTSLYFFVLLIAVLLVGSSWGLGVEAWRTGGQKRWNVAVIVAAYLLVGLIAVTHIWSRLLSIKKTLRTMPKPYVPTKQVDLPRAVADHIMTEYTRTSVIAHISQATTSEQEGWGVPGTKWESQHFRTYILNTLPTMNHALAPRHGTSPLSLEPLFDAADEIGDNGAIRLFVNSYAMLIEKARYSKKEPDEADAAACEKVVDVVLLTLEMKKRRERGEKGGQG